MTIAGKPANRGSGVPSVAAPIGTIYLDEDSATIWENMDGTATGWELIPHQPFPFYADGFENPDTVDWAINAQAAIADDTNNDGFRVRLFDDTIEEGVGGMIDVPAGAFRVTIKIKSRAETTPGGVVAVVPKLYTREIGDNAAIGAWASGTSIAAVSIPASELFQYDEETFILADRGLTAGTLAQFELTRDTGAGGDTLVGDWVALEVTLEFF